MIVSDQADAAMLDQIRRRKSISIKELTNGLGVTTTAMRQRLERLMGAGLVKREAAPAGRGRPMHRYRLAEGIASRLGSNYPDLVLALWGAIGSIADPKRRRELSQQVRDLLAAQYAGEVHGATLDERLARLKKLMNDRGINFDVDSSGATIVIREYDCPYPELASTHRGICALEKQVFDRLLGQSVKLTQCQMLGPAWCEYTCRRQEALVSISSPAIPERSP